MNRIRWIFVALVVVLTGLWFLADPVFTTSQPFAAVQNALENYTGIVAMSVMAVSLLLAIRATAVEPIVGGLDKSYRLHKWLGVAGLVMAVAHWLVIQSQGWLVSLGIVARPKGRGGPPPGGPAILHTLSRPAIGVASWMLYALAILVVLALVQAFPYRRFIQTHRLLAIVYLVLVFHSVVLLKLAYWTQPIGWLTALLLVSGVLASIYILFRRVGRTRLAVGEVQSVSAHGDGGIVAVTICLKDRWPGHDAGQFAFVRFHEHEEPHPFTISSSWHDDGLLTFVIKGLGDYTGTLASQLKPGMLVTVEGPYGRFNFVSNAERQIWVSGGIGITPFVSRMQQLAQHPDGKTIDLFHATSARDVRVNPGLWKLASDSGVRLHVWVSEEEGRLTGEHIRRAVPEWKSADVWFCGPVAFGRDLRDDFTRAGLPARAFHQELFHMR